MLQIANEKNIRNIYQILTKIRIIDTRSCYLVPFINFDQFVTTYKCWSLQFTKENVRCNLSYPDKFRDHFVQTIQNTCNDEKQRDSGKWELGLFLVWEIK